MNRHAALPSVMTVIVMAAACTHPPAPGGAAPAAAARRVATVAAVRTSGQGATVAATVRARQRAGLASRLAASVVALPFREGERVPAGAVVVRLDDAAVRGAVAAAQAARDAATADRERVERLLAKGAATPREREDAAARAAAADAALLAARDMLSYTVLRAPFAGTIAARTVDVGDVVSPGRALVEIEGEGGLELHATASAAEAAALAVGAEVAASIDGRAEPIAARITALASAGDPATHRFELRADLPPLPGLRSGTFARLHLPGGGDDARITVPAEAVVRRGGLTGVFVVGGDAARLRWIAVGATADGTTEVRAGLDAGERVALAPEGLTDGARVAEER